MQGIQLVLVLGLLRADTLGSLPPCVRILVAPIEPKDGGDREKRKWHDTDRYLKTEQ
jgi:hypothetical protein